MKNKHFFILYTRPITSDFAGTIEEREVMEKEHNDFITENEALPEDIFQQKVADRYGKRVEMLNIGNIFYYLKKIKNYLQFFFWVTIASLIIGFLYAIFK